MWEHQTLNLFFFLSVLPPVLCDLMQHHCKMYKKKKKVFATCIFPRVFRFSLLNSFPLTITLLLPSLSLSTTFTALLFTAPVILFQEMEKKYRVKINGGTGIRGNNIMTHTQKEWNNIKRWIWITKKRKDGEKWKERSASFSLYNLFHIRSFYHQTSWILLDDVQCSLSNTHILPIDF